MMKNIISFSYLQENQLSLLEDVLRSSSKAEIESLHDRYVLFCHDNHPYHHDCPMFEYLKKDILHSKDYAMKIFYDQLISTYGSDKVDLLIIPDEEVMRNKITHIVNFAFDKVYKTNQIRIEFPLIHSSKKNRNSIPDIIHSTLALNYDIIDRTVSIPKRRSEINIRRREINESTN